MKNRIGTINLEERNPNGGCLWEWRVRVARNLGTLSRGIEMVPGHAGYRCYTVYVLQVTQCMS